MVSFLTWLFRAGAAVLLVPLAFKAAIAGQGLAAALTVALLVGVCAGGTGGGHE